MPDANKEQTLNQLVGAAFGAAGKTNYPFSCKFHMQYIHNAVL